MLIPPSPPSPFSPPSPATPIEEIIEREKKQKEKEAKINQQKLEIGLCSVKLQQLFDEHFPEEPLLLYFKKLLDSDNQCHDKKYKIVMAILTTCQTDPNFSEKKFKKEFIKKFRKLKADLFYPQSDVYHALNYQQNVIPITFFGSQSVISWNYARSLQDAQSLVQEEKEPTQTPRVSR